MGTRIMHVESLRELINRAEYPLDPEAVADAIVARATLRQLIPGLTFRAELEAQPHRQAEPTSGD